MADSPRQQRAAIASVVIPAHNEERTIGRGLARLLNGAPTGTLDVVVVANACTDATADVARASGVHVIETAVAGKAHALNLGDADCTVFPRLYLDADVEVDLATVCAMVETLDEDGIHACSPVAVLDLRGTGPVVRRVHRVHEELFGPRRALAGVGLYAVDEQGHRTVFPIPDVVADDEWVNRSFAAEERRVVPTARSVVRPAPTLLAHLRRRTRVRMGNHQLALMGRSATNSDGRISALVRLVRTRRGHIVDAGCYLAVTAIDRARFALHLRRNRPVVGSASDPVATCAFSSIPLCRSD